jgi:alpha-glucuronidase
MEASDLRHTQCDPQEIRFHHLQQSEGKQMTDVVDQDFYKFFKGHEYNETMLNVWRSATDWERLRCEKLVENSLRRNTSSPSKRDVLTLLLQKVRKGRVASGGAGGPLTEQLELPFGD